MDQKEKDYIQTIYFLRLLLIQVGLELNQKQVEVDTLREKFGIIVHWDFDLPDAYKNTNDNSRKHHQPAQTQSDNSEDMISINNFSKIIKKHDNHKKNIDISKLMLTDTQEELEKYKPYTEQEDSKGSSSESKNLLKKIILGDISIQNYKYKQESTSNPDQEIYVQVVDSIIEQLESSNLDRYQLLKVPYRIKALFEQINDKSLADELTDLFENYISTPRDKQVELRIISEKLRKKASLPILPDKPTEEMIYKYEKDANGANVLRGQAHADDLMKHLETHYRQYLTYFNKELEVDVLYQNYLTKHDPDFMSQFYNKFYYMHRKDPSKPHPSDIIKRDTDRVSTKVSELSEEERLNHQKITSAIRRRDSRKREISF